MNKTIRAQISAIVGKGNSCFAPEDLLTYSYDGGKHRALPEAVVFPSDTGQVSRLTQLANLHGLPLVPRGAGTGLTGGSLAARGGIVMSLEKMNRIIEMDEKNLLAVVEPGVINAQLQEAASRKGLFFPPDPASAAFSTIGGNIAENAGGMRAVKYGVTKNYVMGLTVVLPTGEIIQTGSKCIKDVVGYGLTELFVGSEGTLGTITTAIVKLLPRPRAVKTMVALFPHIAVAADLVAQVKLSGLVPTVVEFLDRQCILALEAAGGGDFFTRAEAMLLLEVDGHPEQVTRESAALLDLCVSHGASTVREAQSEEERQELWHFRRSLHASLSRLKSHWEEEDIAVPVSRVPGMLERLAGIGREKRLVMACFGHLGDGNIHLSYAPERGLLPPESVTSVRRAIFAAVVAEEGRIAAEHGIGLEKASEIGWNLDRTTLEVMTRLKRVLDPAGILNPGKIFPPEITGQGI